MDLSLISLIIDDVKEQFQREIEQGIMKHDLYQSTAALGGKDACDRIQRTLQLRFQMNESARRMTLAPEPTRNRKAVR